MDAHVEAHARVGVGAGEDESTGIIEEKAHKTLKQNQSQKEKEEAARDDTVLPIEPAERGGAKVFPYYTYHLCYASVNEDNEEGEGEWGKRKNKWRDRWVEGRDEDGEDHQHHPFQSRHSPSHFRVLNAKNV